MSEPSRYPAQVFFSEEDEGFIAIAPDLPGASAFGASADEAVRELQDAIKAWIGAAQKAGNPIPPASTRTEEDLPSGKLLARLPRTLHAQLIARASKDGASLNTCLVMLLSKALTESAQQPVARAFVAGGHSATVTVATKRYRSWMEAVTLSHFEQADRSCVVFREIESGGSVMNLYRLPANKPVVRLEE